MGTKITKDTHHYTHAFLAAQARESGHEDLAEFEEGFVTDLGSKALDAIEASLDQLFDDVFGEK